MQFIDDADFQVAIDLDQGARIASLTWRDMQFATPFRGDLASYGWFAMAPWTGRISEGEIADASGKTFTLPQTLYPPHAALGLGYTASWQEVGPGRSRLELPKPYQGASIEQTIEVLDDAIRWSIEYDAGNCELPGWLGLHPWFNRDLDQGDSAEVIFTAKKMLARDDEKIPLDLSSGGKLISPTSGPWDDQFTEISGVPAIVWGNAARIDIESDAPWWGVNTEDNDSVSLQPMSAPSDAAKLGIVGEHYVEALFTFSVE